MAVDWTKCKKEVTTTCMCMCNTEFRSHGRVDYETLKLVSKNPCPNCGSSTNLRRISEDPEKWTIETSDEDQAPL